MYDVDGPNISTNEVVNIAPGKGQLPVLFNSESDWETVTFVRHFSTGEKHFNIDRKVRATRSKYLHARVKCDDSLASVYITSIRLDRKMK